MTTGDVDQAPPRIDRRGRRIGRNWWREHIVSTWWEMTLVWHADCERVAIGYATEESEYAETNPRPTLKRVMTWSRFRHLHD